MICFVLTTEKGPIGVRCILLSNKEPHTTWITLIIPPLVHYLLCFFFFHRSSVSLQLSTPSFPLPSPPHQVLIYNGQLDIVVGPPLTEAYLQVLPWSGQGAYHNTEKSVWRINPSDIDVAGYTRTVGNFTQVYIVG